MRLQPFNLFSSCQFVYFLPLSLFTTELHTREDHGKCVIPQCSLAVWLKYLTGAHIIEEP